MANKKKPGVKAPPASKHVVDTGVRHQVYLERVAKGVSRDVSKRQLERLEKIIGKMLQGNEVTSLSRKELQALLAFAQKQQKVAMQGAVDLLMSHLENIAVYEGTFTVATLEVQTRGIQIKTAKAAKIWQEAINEPLALKNGVTLEPLIEDWSVKTTDAVSGAISRGYALGQTNAQIATALRGTAAAGYTDGLVANLGRNAEVITRTAVQSIANSARMVTWAANGDVVVGYQIIATLDSNTTQLCRSLDHQVFVVGEGPVPPLHYGCRDTTVAKLDPRYDYLQAGATRSSAVGYVPAQQSYYQWLKDQPSAFQDDAIGPVRGKLFRDGGLSADSFARLNLGTNFQPMTLEEMKTKAPLAFQRAGVLQ